jgi:hypothetical protein
MKHNTGKVILSAILLILLWLALTPSVNAQTPTPPPTRESLIEEIQLRAQRDVEMGADPQSPSDLAVLFSEQAAAVGLTMSEVKNIYDEAYRLTPPPQKTLREQLQPQGGLLLLIIGTI